MASLKQYEGTLRLDLSRKGKVYKRVETKNTVTTLVQDTFLDGNFSYMLERDKAIPEEWFDGCLLTDKQNDPSIMMIAHDSEVIAQAGNDTYTGLNYKRGSFIPLDSGTFTDPTLGFRKVWRWDNSYGNGKINSVCLAPHECAIFDYQNGALPIDGNPPNKVLGNQTLSGTFEDEFDDSLSHLTIIDYNTGKGYYVTAASDFASIIIDEYEVSCSRVRILDRPGYVVRKVGRHVIPISPALPDYDSRFGSWRVTLAYTGDTIHIIPFENFTDSGVEKVRIKDYQILTSDMTAFVDPTPSSLVYSDVWLYTFPMSTNLRSEHEFHKDGFIYNATDGYLYALGREGGSSGTPSMLRFDLNSTDVKAYDLSFAPPAYSSVDNGYVSNCGGLILDNGDFFKFCRITSGYAEKYMYYFHNDKVYAVSPYTNYTTRFMNFSGGKGTVIGTRAGVLTTQLDNYYPYVSTVANLSEEVNKTAEFDMTLQYSVREV